MKLLGVTAIAASLLLLPSSARADGGNEEPARPVRLAAGFGYISSHENDLTVARSRFTISPEFSCGPRLTIAPFMRLTTTTADLRQKDGMPFDLSLTLPWQPSIGARIEYRVYEVWRLQFSLRGEFEAPLGTNEARIGNYTAHGDLAKVAIDTDTLRNHVRLDHTWRSASASTMVSMRLWRFRPYVEFGYILIDSSLAVTFDQKAAGLLESAKVHPNRFYDDGASSFFYMLGTRVDLGSGFELRLNGAFLPTGSRQLFTGEGMLVVPLDFIPGLR